MIIEAVRGWAYGASPGDFLSTEGAKKRSSCAILGYNLRFTTKRAGNYRPFFLG